MRKIKLLATLLAITMLTTLTYAANSDTAAAARKSVFTAPLTWRADGTGQHTFDGSLLLNNASIAKDGSVRTGSSAGICELQSSYMAEGLISNIAANWQFTGKVTMEVTTTGKESGYIPVTNGVPMDCEKSASGRNLKWRATIAPQSSLTGVSIVYKDSSGMAGSMGSPVLSGFAMRKTIFIKSSPEGPLYNFQIPIKVGESAKASGCDVYLDSPLRSDLSDIRFTQNDSETALPYYRESVTGASPARAVTFWVKIPEIPQTPGLPIYIYYACALAADLSSGEDVFDFFDDFNGAQLNTKKWTAALEGKTSQAQVSGSMLSIDAARITTRGYDFGGGIIEYRAKLSGNGGITGIIAAGRTADDDLTAYSSIMAASANCIKQGGKILANSPQQIALDTFYNFRIISDSGNATFQRFADGWESVPQAEAKYQLPSGYAASAIGLSAGTGGNGLVCDYIRARQFAATPPQVDVKTTASGKEETVDLPRFDNVTLAPDGGVVLSQNAAGGDYTSSLISAPFEVRMLTPAWSTVPIDDTSISVSVSTNESSAYSTGWQNGIARYASKKEFTKGNSLRWRAHFSGQARTPANQQTRTPASLSRFSLEYQPGAIRIIAPGGGENLMPGSAYNIIWNTTGYDPSYSMNISYSNDGGSTFQPIAVNTANTGSYAWIVPQDDSILAAVKVSDPLDKTIFGISDNYFTISAEGNLLAASESKADKTVSKPEPEAQAKETPLPSNLYELLIKKKDKTSASSSYQPGDIVMVKPAGYLWGAEEKNKFIIIQAYLTPQEVSQLMSPKIAANGEVTGRRRYMIDMTKKNIKDKVEGLSGAFRGKPMLDRAEIEEKK